jgi:hypothetical protein
MATLNRWLSSASGTNAPEFLAIENLEHLETFVCRYRLTSNPASIVVIREEFGSVMPGDAA